MSVNSIAIIPVPAGNGTGAAVDVSAMGSTKTILVDGSFDAILNIEASGDGVNFAPVANAQGGGLISKQFVATHMRVRVTGYRSGAPTVAVGAPSTGTNVETLDVPVGNGDGAASDISAFGSIGTIFVTTEFGGALQIEASDNGTSWSPVTTFQGPGQATVTLTANFLRTSRTGVGFNPGLPVVSYVAAEDSSSSVFPGPFPAGAPITITIYARQTGSDVTGTGTLANPYRTFVRAVQDVPFFIPSGFVYDINITDLGVETLPDDYMLPAWKGGSRTFSQVTIRATNQLDSSVPAASATINLVDVLAVTADPVTGMLAIQLTPAAALAKGWVAGQFATAPGKIFFDSDGSVDAGAITDNTTDTLFVATQANLPGGPGFPCFIMECSATLEGRRVGGDPPSVGLAVYNNDGIAFVGIHLRGDAGDMGVGCFNCFVSFDFCQIEGIDARNTVRNCMFSGSSVSNAVLQTETYIQNSFMDALATSDPTQRPANQQFFSTTSEIANSNPIEASFSAGSGFPVSNFTMDNVRVRDGLGDGIHVTGGKARFENVRVEDCIGNGITVDQGQAFVQLLNVRGANLGDYGLRVDDGAFVEVDAATNAAGVVGNSQLTGAIADTSVGDLPDAAWPAAGAFNSFDITAVGAGGATGTGSRLFER